MAEIPEDVMAAAKYMRVWSAPGDPGRLVADFVLADHQRLQAEVEALRTDAERYRWLREDHRAVERDGSVYVRWVQMTGGVITGSDILTERDLDMVIDAARATPNETKEAKS